MFCRCYSFTAWLAAPVVVTVLHRGLQRQLRSVGRPSSAVAEVLGARCERPRALQSSRQK